MVSRWISGLPTCLQDVRVPPFNLPGALFPPQSLPLGQKMSRLPTLPDTAPILHELAQIVGLNANDSEPDILDLFVRSKHVMRQVNNVIKAHKDATIHARAEMDAVLLVLQNLLYEKRHVERDITRCQEFGYV